MEPKKPIQIWTIQMAQWRIAKRLDIPLLDITAKSGVHAFAPEMSKVMDYKQGLLSEEEYEQIYRERMQRSQEKLPHRWESLKSKERVALACYCKAGKFCHRHIFAELMVKYLVAQGYEAQLMGEIAFTNTQAVPGAVSESSQDHRQRAS